MSVKSLDNVGVGGNVGAPAIITMNYVMTTDVMIKHYNYC